MCDDVHATIAELSIGGVDTARPVTDEGFGLVTCEPRHPSPLSPAPSTS
jgi:hypothetical protein